MYDKAVQLHNRARQLDAGAKADENADRVLNRCTELRAALGDLRSQVELRHTLVEVGAAGPPDLSAVDSARLTFERKASHGLPDNPTFRNAKNKVIEATGKIRDVNMEAWVAWASARLDALPLARISTLPTGERQETQRRMAELRRTQGAKALSPSDVTLFTNSYTILAEALHGKADPPSELQQLVERLEQRPSPTLREVSDSDIALLRQFDLDLHITLQRTGA
ncbi:hypothetical protein FH609_002425 [Streptomyces sp. 3MP-14]|uniref:Uncharacterized protein n=1 Tax=Streptomyces mimosae TaxID=2586635 RepID=A0A5N6AQA7_9ACTN|nr:MULTISPECIES: hypothetical protein [Streptomyces]KAB8170794.1 hypothetical protein FH607_000045 [Streptomyces mimosae]KAB8179853.1 hypothetical protein FH609_002425 [Streptomyces sp. 3MP-14]